MSALLGLRKTIHKQFRPDYGVRINTASALARGLLSLFYPTAAHGNTLIDLVTGNLCTLNVGTVVNTGSYGRQVDCSLISGASVKVNNPIWSTTGAVSALAVIIPRVLTRGDLITRWNTGGIFNADQFNLLYGLTSGKPQFYVSNNISPFTPVTSGVGANAMSVGNKYAVGGSADGSTIDVFLNGNLEAGVSGSGVVLSAFTPGTDVILGDNAAGAGPFNGQILFAAIWNRKLHTTSFAQMGLTPEAELLIRA